MDDTKIIDLYFERTEDAIKETEQKYGRYIKKVISNILKIEEDVEECISDTLMAVWNSIPPKRPGSLGAFAAGIARNTALNRYDYLTAAKRNSSVEVILTELEDCLSAGDVVENEVWSNRIIELINSFLREQPEEKRIIFIRRYWFCDSVEKISSMYGQSESKVKSTLFRIRKQLKAYLEKEGVAL